MKPELQQFVSSLPTRRSKLEPFSHDMAELMNAGCSYRQVVDYLASKGVKAHPSEIKSFVTAKVRAHQFQQTKVSGSKKPCPPAPVQAGMVRKVTPAAKSALPKLDWETETSNKETW
ncbi:hypothetical protein [Rhodoferax sp.]|uniref:hypothetical protein n=1 Tax=Rhodoferax sp. TaxID=50421 RepID=UPI00274CBC24|nr:hypothetical protein [Rhodoferax sp.]